MVEKHIPASQHISIHRNHAVDFFFVNFSLCNGNFFILMVLTHGKNIQAFQQKRVEKKSVNP